MAEYGGYLYIRTCREMYKSSDGLHHQTNLFLQMRISDVQFLPNVKNVIEIGGSGYTTYYSDWDVSHSFNQFIMIDNDANIVTLDHGNANPRSAVLGVFRQRAGANKFALDGFQRTRVSMMSFGGEYGQNTTKASIGALTYSPETYLAAGRSIDQQKGWENDSIRNVFVSVAPRSDLQKNSVKTSWLTSYPEGGCCSASKPYLVKMGERSFLLLWEELSGHNEYGGASVNGSLFYVYLDQNGMPTSQVYTAEGHLSDCNPIVVNQTAVWYGTSREGLRFYTIDGMGNFHIIDIVAFSEKVRDFTGYVAESGNIFLEWKPVPGAEGYHIRAALSG